MREYPHNLNQYINQLKYLRIINLLIDLILSDIVRHIEERHQFDLEFLMFETKLDLHPVHRVGFHHELDVLLEVVLDDF